MRRLTAAILSLILAVTAVPAGAMAKDISSKDKDAPNALHTYLKSTANYYKTSGDDENVIHSISATTDKSNNKYLTFARYWEAAATGTEAVSVNTYLEYNISTRSIDAYAWYTTKDYSNKSADADISLAYIPGADAFHSIAYYSDKEELAAQLNRNLRYAMDEWNAILKKEYDMNLADFGFAAYGPGIYGTTSPQSETGKFTSGGVSYQVTGTSTICVKKLPNIENVSIPDRIERNGKIYLVTAIDKKAAYKLENIEKVKIPSSVTEIGREAFSGCKKLKEVEVNAASLQTVGKKAFQDVHKDVKVVITSGAYKKVKKMIDKATNRSPKFKRG